MRILVIFGVALVAVQQCTAPPLLEKKKETKEHAEEEFDDDLNVMEYHRYLREVVTVLETDKDFRAKLEKASEDEIKSGNFAGELEYVNHTVRTRLDELKRKELERLRHLATKEFEHENGLDPEHLKIREHIDHENPHTFEVVDLKKLITKTTKDLAEVDRQRREQFQEYEMQKKYDEEERKKKMNEEQRKEYEEQLKAVKKHHKEQKPIHHPGSKHQLEEVWEKDDHMDNAFDPRTFFYMHDVDGNGVWDQIEVNSLFRKELDKHYEQGVPQTDILERREEMERMREHVFAEVDLNKDGLISYAEFIEQSKKPEFEEDKGWETLDEAQIYTEQDYQKFEQRQREEMQRRISMGISPPGHGSYDPGHQQQFQPQYNNIPIDHAAPPHPDFVPPMGARVSPNQQQQHYVNQQQQQQFQGQMQHQQFQGQHQQFQGQQPQFQGQQPQFQAQQPQFQGQNQQYQGQPQIPQYQGHPAQGQLPQQNYQQGQIPQQQQGQIPQQQGQIPQQQGQMPHQQGQMPHQQQGQIPQQQQQGQEQVAAQQQRQKQQQQQSAPPQRQQNIQEKLPSSNQVPQKTGENSLPVVEKVPQSGNQVPNAVQA